MKQAGRRRLHLTAALLAFSTLGVAAFVAWEKKLKFRYMAYTLVSDGRLAQELWYMQPRGVSEPESTDAYRAHEVYHTSKPRLPEPIERLKLDPVAADEVLGILLRSDDPAWIVGGWNLITAGLGSRGDWRAELRASLAHPDVRVRRATVRLLGTAVGGLTPSDHYDLISLALTDSDVEVRREAMSIWSFAHYQRLLGSLRGAALEAHTRRFREDQARLLSTCLDQPPQLVDALRSPLVSRWLTEENPAPFILLIDHPDSRLSDTAYGQLMRVMNRLKILDARDLPDDVAEERKVIRATIPKLEDYLHSKGHHVPRDFGVSSLGSSTSTRVQ